jgi:hypothetical protein
VAAGTEAPSPAASGTGEAPVESPPARPEPPNYVETAEWVDTEEGPTLVVTPTAAARAAQGSYQAGMDGWDQLEALMPDLAANPARGRLRYQYICHQQFATVKEPDKPTWDLELDRPDVDYAATVQASCNP